MKIGLRIVWMYHSLLAMISNPVASVESKVLRTVGQFSNRHEAKAIDAEIEILKSR